MNLPFSTLLDITCLLDEGTLAYPGDPRFRLVQEHDYDSAGYRLTSLHASAHLGTHMDAPAHFLPGATSIDALSLDRVILPARVVCVPDAQEMITGGFLESSVPKDGRALLFRTRNGAALVRREWKEEFCALTEDGALWCRQHDVPLVGIDWLSIEPYDDPGFPVHHLLLEAGILIVENCLLQDADVGEWLLIALPLKIGGGDGSPVRAVLAR